MTYQTRIIVVQPTDAKAAFDHALSLLARGVDFEPTWEHHPAGENGWTGIDGNYQATCGQGLNAWLWCDYATDGPMRWRDAGHDYGSPAPWWDEHCVRLLFDTNSGWVGPNGQHPDDLHAWLVQEMAAFFAERHVDKWVCLLEGGNDEWFGHDDDVRILGDPELGALR